MYRHILVPIDLSHGDVGEHILKVARFLAGDTGRITLLTVMEPVPSFVASYVPHDQLDKSREEARQKLEALARSVGVTAQVQLRSGNAASGILEEAAAQGCDVIIIGSHRPDYRDYLIGSTAARVVRHAPVTVVVERSGPVTS